MYTKVLAHAEDTSEKFWRRRLQNYLLRDAGGEFRPLRGGV
jgi:hypothetical protein